MPSSVDVMSRPRILVFSLLALTATLAFACGGMKPTAGTSASTGSGGGGGGDGAALYTKNCAACHGASGQGGVGLPLSKDNNTTLLQDFPDAAAQVEFVAKGSAAYPDGFGALKKKGTGAMPAWGSQLKPEEIQAVVTYERSLAGG